MNFHAGFFSFKRYLLSFITAFIVTAVICAIISVALSLLSPPGWLYSSIIRYIPFFSAFLSAFFCSTKAGKNGLLTGIICADMYMLILILAGVVIFKNSFPVNSAPEIFSITSAAGAVAGILGINLKK